jgi:multidrug efflux system membrane fusion protein
MTEKQGHGSQGRDDPYRLDDERDRADAPAWFEARPKEAPDEESKDRRDRPSGGGHQRPSRDHDRHRDRQQPPDTDRDDDRPPQAARRRWLWPLVLVLILVVAGGGYYLYRGHGAAKPGGEAKAPDRGVPVKVAEAKTADLPLFLNGLGNVQAFNTVTIRSRVDGELVKVAFEEGQIVQKGDLLAQIDPRPYQAALDQAIAQKAQDEATLANNRRDLERTNQLGDYATRQQRDTQQAGVVSLQAKIQFDEAAIENAQTQLGYTTIRAPLTGRTGLRLIDQGNIVHASDTTGIVEIAQIQPIAVIFTAPQQQLPAIAAAMKRGKVPVTALTSDNQSVLGEGELALVNNAIDAASGTIRLKGVFANADEKLWPGLSVNTRLLVDTLKGVTALPSDAVQRGPDGLFAYVVGGDGKAEKRKLDVGPYSGGQAVIEAGLRPGERVVVSGQYRVTDGAKVDTGGSGGEQDKPQQVSAN